MSKKNFILLLASVLVTVLQSPINARTRKDIVSNDVESLVTATFMSTDITGCISTEVNISGHLRSGRGKSEVFLNVIQLDDCKGEVLFSGIGKTNLSRHEALFDRQLEHASLKTTIIVFDSAGKRRNAIKVSIRWRGLGKLTLSHPLKYATEPGKHIQNTRAFERRIRHANAFGTITILGKKNRFNQSDDANISLLTQAGSTFKSLDNPKEGNSI
jgi:hypothetical protein